MEVIILPTDQAVAMAAALIAGQVRKRPRCVLGLATGRTQDGVYAALRGVDFSEVTTFNLDEYVGATTFREQMQAHFFAHVRVKRAFIPDGLCTDIEAECTGYERAIAHAGGIDLQLLGIGENGHIGFNEPTSSLQSRTRLKTLQDGRHVITMGIATIMEARHCLLLALGERKAPAIAAAVEGPVTAMLPASMLQMHARATVVVDEAAASALKLTAYYRAVYAGKLSAP